MSRGVVFAGLLLAFAAALVAVPAQGGELAPFKGDAAGTIDHATSGCDAGLLYATLALEGIVSHLGRTEISGHHCLNTTTGALTEGLFNMVAASGDVLYATYVGQVIDPNPLRTVIEFTGTFTGGSGRFDGATGGFTGLAIRSDGDIWHANLSVEATGELALVGDD